MGSLRFMVLGSRRILSAKLTKENGYQVSAAEIRAFKLPFHGIWSLRLRCYEFLSPKFGRIYIKSSKYLSTLDFQEVSAYAFKPGRIPTSCHPISALLLFTAQGPLIVTIRGDI